TVFITAAGMNDREIVHEAICRADEITARFLVAKDDGPLGHQPLLDRESIVRLLIFRLVRLSHFRLIDAERLDPRKFLEGEGHPANIAFSAAIGFLADVGIAGVDDDFRAGVLIENSFFQILGLALLADGHRYGRLAGLTRRWC